MSAVHRFFARALCFVFGCVWEVSYFTAGWYVCRCRVCDDEGVFKHDPSDP